MSNPFEYAKDLMTKSECDDTVMERKDYNKFIINRALSFHSDLVFYANFVNEYPDIDNKCHYDFLHGSIPKKNRGFKPWIKSKKVENMEIVKEYFKYSNSKASQALAILTEENLQFMRKKLDKGGV
jgi:hypothetical protein